MWEDRNANGVQDPNEPGINGLTVNLRRASDYSIIATTSTTNGGPIPRDGYYQFTGVCAIDYRVEMVPPAGYFSSQTGQGTDATDSNPNPADVTLPADNGSDQTIDFGFYKPASIGNYVWHDLNGNGRQDDGELPIAGARITLTDCSGNPVVDIAGNAVPPQITVADGLYQFVNLKPGQLPGDGDAPRRLRVHFAVRQRPGDRQQHRARDGNVRLPHAGVGPGHDSVDAGGYIPTALGDRVWQDLNADGQQEGGEPGLAGSTVRLWRCGPDGEAGTADDVDTGQFQTTTESGAYLFSNLAPGCYFVTFTTPFGFVPTVANAGGDASDSDPVGGRTGPYVLASGVPDLTVDAGFYIPGTCSVSLNKTCEVPLAVTSPFTCSDAKPISR